MNSILAISEAFQAGGIWMWAILAVQIVSIAIIIERCFFLYVLRAPKQKQLINKFEADIKKGSLKRIFGISAISKKINPVLQVIQIGAKTIKNMGGNEEVQSRIDEVLLDENEKIEKRTGYLAMLGNVGTLIGLLGTIVGLIQAFSAVSDVDPVQKAALLTNGISMAMNTTAYGLIMAIPALIMYSVLQTRANALSEDLNQASLRVYNWLNFNNDTSLNTQTKSRRG